MDEDYEQQAITAYALAILGEVFIEPMLQSTQKRVSGNLRRRALKDLLARADNEVEADTNVHRVVRLLVYEGPPIFQQVTYLPLGIAMGYYRQLYLRRC